VVRDEAGQLKRLYHGTPQVFPDFAVAGRADTGALYGPGIYMTDAPPVAQGYATQFWGDHAQDALRDLVHAHESRTYYLGRAADARTREEALNHLQAAATYEPLIKQAEASTQRYAEAYKHLFQVGEGGANIRPVYADLKRPFDMDRRVGYDAYAALGSPSGYGPNTSGQQLYENLVSALGSKEAANRRLAELGYDGITHIGGANTGTAPHRVFIAFSEDTVYPSFNVDAPWSSQGQAVRGAP
jgi:hypothetical protein